MRINGTDITEGCLGTAYQFKVTRADREITGDSVIAVRIPAPGQETVWRQITIDIYVKADLDRDSISHDIALILSRFESPADIELDGLDNFYGTLTGWKVSGPDKRRAQKLSLTLKGYFYESFSYRKIENPEEGVLDRIEVSGNTPAAVTFEHITAEDSTKDIIIRGLTPDPRSGKDLPIIIPPEVMAFDPDRILLNPFDGKIAAYACLEDAETGEDIWQEIDMGAVTPIVYSWPMLKDGLNVIRSENLNWMSMGLEGRQMK